MDKNLCIFKKLWQQRWILVNDMPMERSQGDLPNELSFIKSRWWTKTLCMFQKLGYDGNVVFLQTIYQWRGFTDTYPMRYRLQKSSVREKSVIVLDKLGYEEYVRFWQTIYRRNGLKKTYPMTYCLQKSIKGKNK